MLSGRKTESSLFLRFLCSMLKNFCHLLIGSSGKLPDAGNGSDAGFPSRSMAAPLPPPEGMTVLAPVSCHPFHGLTYLFPTLESPSFQSQRTQHLPPRLNQIQVRRVLRL